MMKRLARIVGAYVVASLASGFALLLSLILVVVLGTALGAPASDKSDLGSFLPLGLMMLLAVGSGAGFFIMVVAFVPALIVIAVAEAARLRSVKFYVGAGAIGAIVCWALLVGLLEKPPFAISLAPERAIETVMLVLIAALVGVIAGLVYWRIAGRGAGDWRVPRVSP